MNREKQSAALTSLAAAIALTTFKIVVGWSTGSLGILAEAAHSGLDLIAALMTVFAIRWAERPADATHPYGHGRIETVSALFETMLLIVTCGWIVNEAVRRLWGGQMDIEVNVWSFTVVLTSIVVDVSRSRVLSRAAEKFKSEALEADALHFRTDIWSSSVVLLGLICVTIAHRWPALTILESADAIAALFVAGITLYVSLRLGIRTDADPYRASRSAAADPRNGGGYSRSPRLPQHSYSLRRRGADCRRSRHARRKPDAARSSRPDGAD